MKPRIFLAPIVFLTYLRVKARQRGASVSGSPGLNSGLEETLPEDRLSDSCFLEVVTAVGFLLLQSTDGGHCLNFACQNTHTRKYAYMKAPCLLALGSFFVPSLQDCSQSIS